MTIHSDNSVFRELAEAFTARLKAKATPGGSELQPEFAGNFKITRHL